MHYWGVSDINDSNDPLEPLVRRYLLSGDEAAMDRLVERTRPKLLTVARRIGAPQDAEDAVQGAYMALLRKRGSDLEAPVLPWLLTTVIRLAYRRKAKHGRQRELAQRLAQPREPAAPEQEMLDAEREVLVRGAVARLPSTYRDAVVLRHLEGLSTKDTAALLDVNEATVRTRLHRGARLLRGRVSPALLALMLAIPWCAADALRRVPALTQTVLGKPLAVAGLGSGLLLGAVALFGGFDSTPSGTAAHPASTRGQASVPPRPPEPDEQPDPERHVAPVKPEDDEQGPLPPKPLPPIEAPSREGSDSQDRDDQDRDGTPADDERLPSTPPPHLPTLPGMLPIDAGDRPDVPVPPGMALLDGGYVPIGTDAKDLDALLAGRPIEHRKFFTYEAPRHRAFVRPYFIGRYEVSNAQYLVYLRDHTASYTTAGRDTDTLEAIGARLVGQSRDEGRRPDQTVWLQLYRANKGRIWRALGKRMDKLFVWRTKGEIDEHRTALALRLEPLPAGLELDFYSVRPPQHWPDMKPSAGHEDHPVRFVSYNDAERFAEWAGMHLPTEQEWEWAARGPKGNAFPWGADWVKNASRANWGGQRTDAQHETTTLPVDSHGKPIRMKTEKEGTKGGGVPDQLDGRSWCGLHNMTGNVAEWTSSWFAGYPGQTSKHGFMGRWVKVIRGGGAADGEMLVLRPACRNWIGGGADAPPYPENAFQWVGIRLAAWRTPGRDHVPPMLRRMFQGKRVKPGHVAPERFAAFVTRDWEATDKAPANHVYVRGRSRAVVFVPVTTFLREDGMQAMQDAWKRPTLVRGPRGGRLRGVATPHPFWILGALHTDLALHDVQVAKPLTSDPKKKKRRRDTRGRAQPPATEVGVLKAGTYLLVAWHGRLALTTPTLEFRCFLPGLEEAVPSVEVRPRLRKELGSPTLKPTLETGEGDLDFAVPLGGTSGQGKWLVRVRARLPFKPGYLYAHAPWLGSR